MSEALAGNYASARMSAEEGLRLAHETEQLGSACHLQATLALVAGTCGDEEECRRRGEESLDQAVPRGLGLPIANVSWAFGRLDLGLGRHEAAVDHLLSMHGTEPGQGNPIIALWATPDLVEAAVRAGRQADVTDAIERFDAWAAASGQPTAVASVARCRGLLDDPDALDLLTKAADTFRAAHSPYEEARTELVLGELLDAAVCAVMHASTCGQPSARLSGSVPAHGPSGQPPSCAPLGNRYSATASTAYMNSRLRSCRSFATFVMGHPTAMSPPSCSSAHAPSSTTSTRPTQNSASRPGPSSSAGSARISS